MCQDGLPLALVWDPGDRGGNRDQATLSTTNAFSNGIESVLAMAQSNAPAVKAAHSAHTPPDRRKREGRAGEAGNLAAVRAGPIPPFRFSLPQAINVVSHRAFIGFEQI